MPLGLACRVRVDREVVRMFGALGIDALGSGVAVPIFLAVGGAFIVSVLVRDFARRRP